jgi:hypothetical protein
MLDGILKLSSAKTILSPDEVLVRGTLDREVGHNSGQRESVTCAESATLDHGRRGRRLFR